MKTPIKTTTVFLAALALQIFAAKAQTAQAQSSPPAEPYQLKHHSSFTTQEMHNPFWPIGWEKGAVIAPVGVQAEAVAPISADSFRISSISTGAMPLAVINGKEYGEGETINAMYGGQKLKILVLNIGDGFVVLQYMGKKYTVEMKHPELLSPKKEQKEYEPRNDAPMVLH